MTYIRIDLHRDFFVAVGQDVQGIQVLKERYENTQTSVDALVAAFPVLPEVVVEATRNWFWFVRALQEKGCFVQLAHPFRTKAIASARIKTDVLMPKRSAICCVQI